MDNFQPLEVVDRGSETQPQVVENLNKFTQQEEGYGVLQEVYIKCNCYNTYMVSSHGSCENLKSSAR